MCCTDTGDGLPMTSALLPPPPPWETVHGSRPQPSALATPQAHTHTLSLSLNSKSRAVFTVSLPSPGPQLPESTCLPTPTGHPPPCCYSRCSCLVNKVHLQLVALGPASVEQGHTQGFAEALVCYRGQGSEAKVSYSLLACSSQ